LECNRPPARTRGDAQHPAAVAYDCARQKAIQCAQRLELRAERGMGERREKDVVRAWHLGKVHGLRVVIDQPVQKNDARLAGRQGREGNKAGGPVAPAGCGRGDEGQHQIDGQAGCGAQRRDAAHGLANGCDAGDGVPRPHLINCGGEGGKQIRHLHP
jgi:hypothetical protein